LTMNKDKLMDSPESISKFVRQFQSIRILLTAFELDIFSRIGHNAMTAEQVAERIKTNPRATDRLLNALCVLGLLDKHGNTFSNNPVSGKYLVRGAPGYMAGLMHQVHLWDTWTTLTECVKKGTSVLDRPDKVNDRDPEYLQAFIDAMHYRAKDNAAEIVSKINLDGVKRVLDVGGGSGVYSMAFVKAGKNISATVFDLSNVIPITNEYIQKEKMIGKIDTVVGDYNKDDLPGGYDIVFLSAIVHSNSILENQILVNKCSSALNPGGRIIIKDQVMDESRTNPAGGALFSLNMLVNTRAGDTFTEREIKEWLDHAGIRFEETVEIRGQDSMVIGKKE
jgi:2-polyprenyl-3-methyl-5-hydroxy-6-metoxy-1,4-benzoquinol methylase